MEGLSLHFSCVFVIALLHMEGLLRMMNSRFDRVPINCGTLCS